MGKDVLVGTVTDCRYIGDEGDEEDDDDSDRDDRDVSGLDQEIGNVIGNREQRDRMEAATGAHNDSAALLDEDGNPVKYYEM